LKNLKEVSESYQDVEEGMPEYTEAIYAYGEALGLDMLDPKNFSLVSDNFNLINESIDGNI
jgi:hypothetical protein